jgi:hypothetical protein
MRGAARAAEMTEEGVALEKLKGLAKKEAARKAATGQAGKAKRAAKEAERWAAKGHADKDKPARVEATSWAATRQADKDKHAGAEAKRKAATGQAGKVKRAAEEATRKAASGQEGKKTRAAEEATRWAKKKAEAATALEEAAAKQRQSRQAQRELHANLTRKTHETLGAAWCAAEARKLNDSYFPGVRARILLCALASFALAPPSFVRARIFCSCPTFRARRRAIFPKSKNLLRVLSRSIV